MSEHEVREFIIEHLEHELKVRNIQAAALSKDGITQDFEDEFRQMMQEFIEFAKANVSTQKIYSHIHLAIDRVNVELGPYDHRSFKELTKEERSKKRDVMGLVIALNNSVSAIDFAVQLIEL